MSAVVYETRGGDSHGAPFRPIMPTPRLRQARLRHQGCPTLRADEQAHRITPSREPDDGFVRVIYCWSRTGDLAAALAAADVNGSGSPLAGVSCVGAVELDLLDQVRNAANPELRSYRKRAIIDDRRGVVAVPGRLEPELR